MASTNRQANDIFSPVTKSILKGYLMQYLDLDQLEYANLNCNNAM